MPESLMERTRRLLHEQDKSLAEVYGDLIRRPDGTGITYYWLRKFSAGNVEDPSVNRVQELYEYLTGTTLFAA